MADELYDADDELDTQTCVQCGQEFYEDAERCPHCGEYVTEEFQGLKKQPLWIVVTVALCLCMILYWILGPAVF